MRVKLSCQVCVVLLALLVLGGCRKKGLQKDQLPSVAVRLLKVKKRLLQNPIVVFGQTEAYAQSQPSFQVSGVVEKILVDEGDEVKKGQPLASLDKESIQLNLKLSKARYWEAATTYRKFRKGYRKEIIQQQYAAYKRSRAAYKNARSQYLSRKRLRKKGAISEDVYAGYLSAYQSAKASMEQALQSYKMHLRGPQKEDVQVAGVKASQARTQLALAKKQLRDAVLKSPFAGVIALRRVNVGEVVSSRAPAFLLMDLTKIKIRVGVPERVIHALKHDQEAFVSYSRFKAGVKPGPKALRAGIRSRVVAVGKLARKGIVIDKATLTYPVEIVVDNVISQDKQKKPSYKLLPGKVVLVAFPRQDAKQGISVPIDAVLHDGKQKFVYVAHKGKAKRAVVSTGALYRNEIVITKGLRDGMQVVVRGHHQLDEGRRLYIIEGEVE